MGTPFIHSTDLQTVVTQSELVVVVKANEISPGNWNVWDRDQWLCTVKEGLKGEWQENSEIEVIFPKNTVTAGNDYVVAVHLLGGKCYAFEAPNSMYDMSKLPEIKGYLGLQ